MLKIVNARVQSFDIDHFDVWWEIEDVNEDVLNYDFEILRSESPEGPWDVLTEKFQDRYMFRDGTIPRPIFNRNIYYRIRITDRRTNEVEESESREAIPPPSLRALEIIRQNFIKLREFNGRKVLIFPIRTFGQSCPHCRFDDIDDVKIVSHCPTCFSTGWVGGFFHPIESLMMINPERKVIQVSDSGKTEIALTTAWTIPYPTLKEGDLIVEAENRRWTVVPDKTIEILRHPVKQEIRLNEVIYGDMAYKVPVDWEMDPIQAGPARELTMGRSHEEMHPDA